jgi:spermidine synthase
MKQQLFPYHIGRPPQALRKAKLDNIALVPASLLFRKEKYRTIANNLPGQGVLICQTEKKERLSHILEHVADFFRKNGRFVRILPYSLLM